MVGRCIRFTILFFVACPVVADAPLRPPSILEFWSANKRFCAVSVPTQARIETDRQGRKHTVNDVARTTVYEIGRDGSRVQRWSVPEWFRCCEPSDDGKYFVAGYDGLNLLPRSTTRSDITSLGQIAIVRIYHLGKMSGKLELSELLSSLRNLKPTVSHYYWGDYLGFNSSGKFVLTTCEGNRIQVDLRNPGKILKQKM